MVTICFRHLVQILVRYAIVFIVGITLGMIFHTFVFNAMSGSYFSKMMIFNLFVLALPSVVTWHLLIQVSVFFSLPTNNVEIKLALLAAIISLVVPVILIPEFMTLAPIDLTLFIVTFIGFAGLCGYTMGWLKTKEWKLCRMLRY